MDWSKAKGLSEQVIRYLDACDLPNSAKIAEHGPEEAQEHWLVSVILNSAYERTQRKRDMTDIL